MRVATIVFALVVALFVAAAAVFYFNQHRIIVAVLASIKQQTGIDIIPTSSRLYLTDHLIVELDHPRVMQGQREIVALERIRAVVNLGLISSRGLPLRELDLERPKLTAPFDATSTDHSSLPRPGRELIDTALARLADLSAISRRFMITDLELRDQSGILLLRDAKVVAYHHHATPALWTISFKADCEFSKFRGAHAEGDFHLGEGGDLPATRVLDGTLRFSHLALKPLNIGNIETDGQAQGRVKFSVATDAAIEGVATVGLKTLILRSPDFSTPLPLGDYSLEARFSTSPEQLSISKASVVHDGRSLVAGQANILKPYESNPQIAFAIAELNVAWKDILAPIRSLRRKPQELETLLRSMKTGRIAVTKASFDSPLATLEKLSLKEVLAKIAVNATLTELSFSAPPQLRLPDISGASVQIIFAKQILSLLQGSAKVGNSELRDLNAKVDLSKGLDTVPYDISLQADLDLAQLQPATVNLLESFNVNERDRLTAIGGAVNVELDASGNLQKNQPTRPQQYLVKVEPHNVSVVFRGAPGPIGISLGTITLRPNFIKLEKVTAQATGGTANFNGELEMRDAGVQTSGLRIDMHQMPIERWLEGLVDPDAFAAAGNIGGEVIITGDPKKGFLANGKFTLQSGRVQFAFLRSPISVHPAIMTIRDRTLVVSMPAADLENSPIDLDLTVPDLNTPSIRIDAKVQRLDIEALKFVRLPWKPPTPTQPPKFPISGHIEAREANLESFVMKSATTDFKYRSGDWSVDNLNAAAMEGHLNLNIVGRKKDDWIRIFGRDQNFNAASIFLLNRKVTRAPISGRLDLTADLWADTDSNFFKTLAGTAILKLRDGTVDRFTVLSRLLEFIDLRSWLTAKVPDPRVAGLQFRTVSADFKGSEGVFYTDDLLLDGPVIDIVASGNVNVDQSTLDMKVGMIPFNTVNWLLGSIPLVGKNVAGGTKSIISAYFNVRGPMSNPSVTPAPISTVAELLKKTLGLPINLIRPDTIK
jgi:hypothetical protein